MSITVKTRARREEKAESLIDKTEKIFFFLKIPSKRS